MSGAIAAATGLVAAGPEVWSNDGQDGQLVIHIQRQQEQREPEESVSQT